jgi:uncharacterized repeat protein (TIGR03803 family)
LHSFAGHIDGAGPSAALAQGSDGNFYGTTGGVGPDGNNGIGTMFKISTNGSLITLHTLNYLTTDGSAPNGLVQGSDGNFYGTTFTGPTNGNGTVFKITTNGALTTLHYFINSSIDGGVPQATLVEGSDGAFYGTTLGGGTNNDGSVFRLAIVPEPPQLSIIPSGTNVVLTWPAGATGFTLKSTLSFGAVTAWNPVSPLPVVRNGQNTVTNPITGTEQFYRLKLLP